MPIQIDEKGRTTIIKIDPAGIEEFGEIEIVRRIFRKTAVALKGWKFTTKEVKK